VAQVKKFQFRLERVLRYHQQRLKQAELKVAQAAMERDAAQARVRECQEQIEQACELNETVGGLINPMVRANVMAHVEKLVKTLAQAREKLKLAEQQFRDTDRVRNEIAQDVEGLLLLRKQQRLEHSDEATRQQQIELDEVVMRQWSSHSADEPSLPAGMPE
jgi:flagellar export protein FliJ